MCGLVGLISRRAGGFWGGDLDIMENMMIFDQVRGKDSTGAFSVYKNKQSEVIKVASHPNHLFACKAWGDFRSRVIQRGKLVIGHNRKATIGEVKTENAHPFVEDNIILVHNGSLWDKGKSLTKKEVEVDSNAIAHALSGGADPKEVLPEIRGPFALIWYDTLKEKMYAIRNEDRPLHLLTTAENYVLSSEPLIAALALERNNQKITDMVPFVPGDLYEFGELGRFEVSKVDLSKKSSGQSRTSHTTGQAGKAGTDYSNATRCATMDCGDDYGSWEDMVSDNLENEAPFVAGSTENPENRIKELRQKLAEQHDKKYGKTTPSNVCALTQQKDGATPSREITGTGLTHSQKEVELTVSEHDRTADNNTKMIQVDHPRLKKGMQVLLQVKETFRVGKVWRFRGKIWHPGEQLLDCVGCCPDTYSAEAIGRDFVGKTSLGTVHFVTGTTNGLSIYIRDLRKPELTQTWKNRTPFLQWQHALMFCTCIKCGQKAKPHLKNYTSVSSVGIIEKGGGASKNIVKMMCPDCLATVIEEKEREDFKKGVARIEESLQQGRDKTTDTSGDNAVQDRERVSPPVGGEATGKIIVPGTQTLQ